MSKHERPPEEKALFDRVVAMLHTSKAQTPRTVEEVAALSDLDAALTLCVLLCADVDDIIRGARVSHRCGHCIRAGVETWEDAKRYTDDEVTAHVHQCPHNPLVRAVWAALNAQDTLDNLAAMASSRGHRLPEEREIEPVAHATIEALRRMVGR